jgi:S1-C subfamily serine protease
MSKRTAVTLVLLALLVSALAAAPAMAEKTSERGWLGVYIQDIDRDMKEAMDLESRKGVLIRDVVDDSPADDAGVEQEDVIIEFDGKSVRSTSQFTKLVRATSPGEEVVLTLIRDGKEKTLTVVLGKLPKGEDYLRFGPDDFLGEAKKLKPHAYSLTYFSGGRIGVKVQDLTEQLAEYFGVEDAEAVLITEVEEDMPAHEAGLKAGDVVVEADGQEVDDTEDLRGIISEKEEGEKVKIKVLRDRNLMTFEVGVKEGDYRSSSGLDALDMLKLYTPKVNEAKILLKEQQTDLEEEMEELKEEMEELKKELQDLREKLR